MTHYFIERQTDIPLEFDGILLGETSSKDDAPGKTRWQEIRIYRTTSNKYVTEVVAQTIVADERIWRTVNVFDSPDKIRTGLRRRHNGRWFLSDLALEALDLACEHDPALRATLTTEKI